MSRPSTAEIMLDFAALLAQRSTCERAAVGCVVTDVSMLQVLGIGYNGNARGLHNGCDHPEVAGGCGCLHAEVNALLKAPGVVEDKVLFTTTAPCLACAKAIINSNVGRVYVRKAYRDDAGVSLLVRVGVEVWSWPVGALSPYRIDRDRTNRADRRRRASEPQP